MTTTKPCKRCGESKPLDAFGVARRAKDGRNCYCRPCQVIINREYRQAHPEKVRSFPSNRYASNAEKRREDVRRSRAKLRAEVHAALGGACACCGETTNEFLTIDHIGGRSGEHVGAITERVRRLIRSEGYPPEKYRLLCWNCNAAHGIYGYCPHERELKAVG